LTNTICGGFEIRVVVIDQRFENGALPFFKLQRVNEDRKVTTEVFRDEELRDAAAASPEHYAQRLLVLWLAPTYVALLRWNELTAWAAAHGVPWPLPATAQAAFGAFSAVYTSAGLGAGALSEGGHGLAWLQSQLPTEEGAIGAVTV
jgi:hypothetical protein